MKKVFDNKKIVLGFFTMVVVLAIVVVSSFFPFILDFEKLTTKQFITDQLFILVITITATVAMMWIAQAGNAQNPKSEIAKAKVDFASSIIKVGNHTHFYQWIKTVLQPNDRRDIAEKEMLRLGVAFSVYDLTDTEIRSLTVAQKIDGVFYKALDKNQIQGVIALKKRIANIKFVSPNYYTSCKSFMSDKNLSQIASNENKKKISTVVFQLVLKILMSFIAAAILTSFARDLTQAGENTAQAWMRFLARAFAYITSSFLGYTLGCKMNDLDAFYISKRIEAHTLYLEDKNFAPEDEAKKEYIERVKKEQVLQLEHREN